MRDGKRMLVLDSSELWHLPRIQGEIYNTEGFIQCSASPVHVIAFAKEDHEITLRYRRCPKCFQTGINNAR